MFRFVLLAVVSAMCAMTAHTASAPGTAAVRYDTPTVRMVHGVPYLSLVELAERYRLTASYDPATMVLTLGGSHTIRAAHRSPVFWFDNDRRNMVHPALLIRGALYAPAAAIVPLLDEALPGELAWDADRRAIRVIGRTATITGIHSELFGNGCLVSIGLAVPLPYTVSVGADRWLTVYIEGGSFDRDGIQLDGSGGLIREMRAVEQNGGTQLSFLLGDRVSDIGDILDAAAPEIRLTLHAQPVEVAAVAAPAADLMSDTPGLSPVEPAPQPLNDQQWRIDTVVIDPGHGGRDPGAVGPRGTREKDIVLAVALELKRLIDERKEVKAVLTRDSDVFVPLKDRADIATAANGKLFLSIHANAHTNRGAKGMEVFFLSEAKTEAALEVARRENASLRFEEDETYTGNDMGALPEELRDLVDIRMMIHTDVFIGESQDMCAILIDNTSRVTKQESRGVKQGPFYVMLGTQGVMPSVLFEAGFISNPEEEQLLNRASYQKRLAEAIYDAIITFKHRHENTLFGSN